MTIFQKLLRPLLLTGILCLSWGVANAQVYVSPTGGEDSTHVGSDTTWSFDWNATDWGTSLNGAQFNMAAVGTGEDDSVVLTLYSGSGEDLTLLATDTLTNDQFCAQYGEDCGSSSSRKPIQFTFADPVSMDDGAYTFKLASVDGVGDDYYTVALGGEEGGAEISATPEPATMALMGSALVAIGAFRKRLKAN